MKFRKRPVEVEATQWFKNGDHPEVVPDPVGHPLDSYYGVKTLEGFMRATPGDWIITGVNGEHYPCKPDIFDKTYERVE